MGAIVVLELVHSRPAPSSPLRPSLDALRRLSLGFAQIDMMRFCGCCREVGIDYPEGEMWMRFYASPFGFVGEPEHDQALVAMLVELAWELGE